MHSTDTATGLQLAQQGRWAEALPYLEKANRVAPTEISLLHAVASALQLAGRPADAVSRYLYAISLLPENPELLTALAYALLLTGDRQQARALLERALRLDPGCADAGGFLAVLLREAEDADAACAVLRPLVDRYPMHPDLAWQFALALVAAEQYQDGQSAYERYRGLRPQDPLACVALGRLAVYLGQRRQAVDHFRAALAIDPDNAPALWGLAQSEGWRLDPPMHARIRQLSQSEQDPRTAAALEDLLARHADCVGDYHAASEHMTRMNALQAKTIQPQDCYHPRQREMETDDAIFNNTPSIFARLRGTGSTDRRPVFVIGLPRSGTTLLERMLASHPSVVGVGEQPLARAGYLRALSASGGKMEMLTSTAVADAANWHLNMLEERLLRLELDRDAERIVDKLPDNYMFAGWLRIAFPNAAIIHCLRDPRDVALSCWQTQFADITWSFELEHIAHRIEQHRRLLRHWRATIGDHLTEIHYERLVADPETELRRALAAIGLEWHADVLGFAERKGVVRSASQQQVRQPLHARSVGRWRHYKEALQPILPRLNAIAAQDALDAETSSAP